MPLFRSEMPGVAGHHVETDAQQRAERPADSSLGSASPTIVTMACSIVENALMVLTSANQQA